MTGARVAEPQRLRSLYITMLSVGCLLLIAVLSAGDYAHSPRHSGRLQERPIQDIGTREYHRTDVPLAQSGGISDLPATYKAPGLASADRTEVTLGAMLILVALFGLRGLAVAEGKRTAIVKMTIERRNRQPFTIAL